MVDISLKKFEQNIGYEFKNLNLLKTALTHTSYAYENKTKSYERLEYLGDSILEFISSKYLFENFQELSEGEMTKVRAYAVCENSLYEIAVKHNFSDFLYLGKSEKSTKTDKKAILADCVEAVIAAIYLDSNDIKIVQNFILENIKDAVEYASKNVGVKDYKTVLQEKLQENGEVNIRYNIINESGPDHNKTFTAEVECDGKKLASGTGRSKKGAEMEAARKAIELLS
ncbi:MAG TPA: ribonuclease III [Candidatus Scatovivens faecipullorum]|nr:ribonuclease III [Candidatus Scatovivens faecipullorum]